MLKKIQTPLSKWWQQRRPATRSLPRYLGRAVMNYIRSGTGSRQAAALSYFAIFSIFPLTLLLAVGIGNIVGPVAAQEQLARGLEIFLPEATVVDIQSTLESALGQSSSFGLVAFAALIWAATGLFTNINLALDGIFEVENPRDMFRQRVVAVAMGLTLVVLVLASFVTSGVLRLLSAFTPGVPNVWVRIAISFLPMGLDVVIFALIFRFVPLKDIHWDAVWPAAIFGSLGWELAKRGFEWYLTNLANYWIIYGSIATGIVLLFWAWLIASIFLFSAELCARLNEWLLDEEERRVAELERVREISIRLPDDMLQPPPLPTETTPYNRDAG